MSTTPSSPRPFVGQTSARQLAGSSTSDRAQARPGGAHLKSSISEPEPPRPRTRPRWSPARRLPPPGVFLPGTDGAILNGPSTSTSSSTSASSDEAHKEGERPDVEQEAEPSAGGPTTLGRPSATLSEHVYNQARAADGTVVSRAALCVEAVTDRHGRPTVKLEGAGPHPTLANRYDWDSKVVFFAEPDELQGLLCVLLGYQDAVSYSNHGVSKSKFLKLKRQPDSFYCTLGEGRERSVAIKIPVGHATRIALLLFRQFQRASFGLEASALNLVLVRVTAPLTKSAAAGA